MGLKIFPRGGYAEPGTSVAFRTGDWRTQRPQHRHRAAPCHVACPAGEDPQAWLARIDEESPKAAWLSLIAANPLPGVTGRVCPHPCEGACNRGAFDQAIAIHTLERYLGDTANAQGWAYPVPEPGTVGMGRESSAPVAVIGAGPAGLACAWHLRRRGYRVTVFEAENEAGGLLRSAIPPYRLPRSALDGELERLFATGIELRTNHRLGRDMSLKEIEADHAAVFLAPGAQRPRPWSVQGATPRDLHAGLPLLKEWLNVEAVPAWKSVAIVGAGNTAVDLARILKRAGVPDVHIVSHKAIPAPGVPANDAMPALAEEIHEAVAEGVHVHEHRGVERLILRGEQVVGLEMVHMKKLEGSDGRLHRIAFEGTETVLKVDHVVPAVGQIVDPEGLAERLSGRDYIRCDPWGRLDTAGLLFTGGDARGDRGTVTEAVGDGRIAAASIDAALREAAAPALERPEPIPVEALNLNYYEPGTRVQPARLPVEVREGSEEIEQGLGHNEAVGEARRCLSCGECLACDNCWTLCPDSAVLKIKERASDGSHYVFDYDFCKGCGLCAQECPCGFIEMIDEG